MNVSLWERDSNVMLVQCFVYTLQNVAYHVRFLGSISPDKKVEIHARFSHFRNDTLNLL